MDSLSGAKVASNVLGMLNDKLPAHFITFYPVKNFIKIKTCKGVLIAWTKKKFLVVRCHVAKRFIAIFQNWKKKTDFLLKLLLTQLTKFKKRSLKRFNKSLLYIP